MKTDEFSGQPASKSTPVKLSKYNANWYGFAVLAGDVFESINIPLCADYWAKVRIENGVRAELAGSEAPASWTDYFQSMLGDQTNVDVLEMTSPTGSQARFAAFREDKLIGLLYTADEPVVVSRAWACSQLLTTPEGMQRHRLLAGRPGADMPEKGAIICSCMNVGANEIRSAAETDCHTVEAISECTTAGTNCGSCLPEIRAILNEVKYAAAE